MRWLLSLLLCASLHAEPFGKPRTKVLGARTQLEFDDQTIIRLGANTSFRFLPGTREAILSKGTLLFSSPKGAGGALLHSGSTVVTMTDGDLQMSSIEGSVKVICMTGKVHVASNANLKAKDGLRPGEMVVVPPGATRIPPTSIINMATMIATSGLLKMGPLPSQALIERNARKQKGAPKTSPPRADSEAISSGAMTTVQISQQQEIFAQQAAQAQAAQQAAAEAAAAQQLANARQLALQQQQQQAAIAAEQERQQQQRQAQQAVQQQQQANQRGPQGNQGRGPQGNQGQGPQGNQGRGPQGNQGQGPQGNQGQGQGNQGQGNNPPGQQPGGPPGQQ